MYENDFYVVKRMHDPVAGEVLWMRLHLPKDGVREFSVPLVRNLAVVLAARPPLLLLDEPTRGLDYPTKTRLVEVLRDLARAGHGIMLATHDVELAAEVATRVVVLAEGEIVADGNTADVVVASPMFAPQVAKVLAPEPWLTVSDVLSAIGPLLLRSHAPTSGDAVG